MSKTSETTYVVECCHPQRGRRIKFELLQKLLRGRLQQDRVDEDIVAARLRTTAPAVIPGIHLELSGNRLTLRDPMVSDSTLSRWAMQQARQRNEAMPPETEEFEVDHHECLYEIWRHVKAGNMVPVGCKIPERAEINHVPPERPFGPQPKRGKDRLKEVFMKNPQTAADYVKMTEDERRQFEALIGV